MPTDTFSISDAQFTDEANIYIHIPFCNQLCSFCGYLKTVDRAGTLQDGYIDALIGEIRLYAPLLSEKTVRTLHFGGGTPTLISDHQLERVLRALTDANPRLLHSATEVSIESTPERIEKKRFETLRDLGFNRVSIGVQTLDDREIALSGRKNGKEISSRAISSLQDAGILNVVVDLMIGIGGQTVKSFERSAQSLASLRPDTVELYALGLMPETRLSKAFFSGISSDISPGISPRTASSRDDAILMGNDDIYRCYSIGQQIFSQAGYVQDCHNRYAIPCRGGFLQEDYLFDGMSVIGLGAGARSYARNIQYRNVHSLNGRVAIAQYIATISSGRNAVTATFVVDDDERARQYAIGHIESLDRAAFSRSFGPFEMRLPEELRQLQESGIAHIDESIIALNPDGLKYRDLVARMFFSPASRSKEREYRSGVAG